jgi:tripartite-type tricarboxylate transporter receptor subunit TctC
MMRYLPAILTRSAIAAMVFCSAAHAQGVADFYRGKNVAVAIAFSPGGGYDLYARTLARHMGKYIPGNPVLVPQNMPGAGGLRVAQYYSQAAPKDGLTFGTFTRMAGIAPLFDSTQKYDASKLTWLGAITDSVSVCVTWHTSPVKNWKDFLEKPVTLGGTGPSGELDIFTNLYKNVFGANIKLVSGYPGTAEIMLAMERGELDGVCGIDWTSIKAQRQRWIKEKQINVIAQAAFRKDPDLQQVPLIMELTKDPEKLQILKLFVSAHEFARPYAAPPGIPSDRAAALITAFEATMKDEGFLADTAKHQMEVAPVSGTKLAEMLAELYKTPEAILAKARSLIAR